MTAPTVLNLERFVASGGTAEQLDAVSRIIATGYVWAKDDKALENIIRAVETKGQYR